jgi:hypothetical protein
MSYCWPWKTGRALTLVLWLLAIAAFAPASTPYVHAQSTTTPPVNVAGTYLFVECPALVEATVEVKFAYVQLDGNAAVRSATAENRGLVVSGNTPVVALSRLSFDFSQDALYRFVLADNTYIDVLVESKYWAVDRRNSILYTGLSC